MALKLMISFCFLLVCCNSESNRVKKTIGSSDNKRTSSDIVNISVSKNYKIIDNNIFLSQNDTFVNLGAHNEFLMRGMIYYLDSSVVYNVFNGMMKKEYKGESYFHNHLGVLAKYDIDRNEPFKERLEDTVFIKVDISNTLVLGANSALLFWVKDVIYPKQKYNHLISSYLLVEDYIDNQDSILSGVLDYVVESKNNEDYVHYGYRLLQKASGALPREPDDQ